MNKAIKGNNKMTKKIRIHVILDRSGSMSSIREDAIGGVNSYVKAMKDENTKGKVSVSIFDSQSIDTIRNSVKIADYSNITDEEYQPRAMTPLFDAIGYAVLRLEKEASKVTRQALVIVTD